MSRYCNLLDKIRPLPKQVNYPRNRNDDPGYLEIVKRIAAALASNNRELQLGP